MFVPYILPSLPTRSLVLSATEGLNPAAIGKVPLDSEQGLVGLVATSSEPINVRDAARHPRFKLIPQCEEAPYHGFLGVPVIHRGDTLGVIVVQQAKVRRCRDTDVAFLVTLATQLAGVITLARASGAVASSRLTSVTTRITWMQSRVRQGSLWGRCCCLFTGGARQRS